MLLWLSRPFHFLHISAPLIQENKDRLDNLLTMDEGKYPEYYGLKGVRENKWGDLIESMEITLILLIWFGIVFNKI